MITFVQPEREKLRISSFMYASAVQGRLTLENAVFK